MDEGRKKLVGEDTLAWTNRWAGSWRVPSLGKVVLTVEMRLTEYSLMICDLEW